MSVRILKIEPDFQVESKSARMINDDFIKVADYAAKAEFTYSVNHFIAFPELDIDKLETVVNWILSEHDILRINYKEGDSHVYIRNEDKISFELIKTEEFIALCDLLKRVGLCESGGHAKAVISQGEVIVDGQVELRKRAKIRSGQVVEFSSEKIQVI